MKSTLLLACALTAPLLVMACGASDLDLAADEVEQGDDAFLGTLEDGLGVRDCISQVKNLHPVGSWEWRHGLRTCVRDAIRRARNRAECTKQEGELAGNQAPTGGPPPGATPPASAPTDGGSPPAGGGAPPGVSPPSGGTPPSGGAAPGEAPSSGPRCNAIVNDGPVAVEMQVPSDPPVALGGMVRDGRYRLTAITVYTGPCGAKGPTGTRERLTVEIAGTTLQRVEAEAVAPPGSKTLLPELSPDNPETFIFRAAGGVFTRQRTCPSPSPEQKGTYTATSHELKIYSVIGGRTVAWTLTRA